MIHKIDTETSLYSITLEGGKNVTKAKFYEAISENYKLSRLTAARVLNSLTSKTIYECSLSL